MRTQTRLEQLCEIHNQQGGTIHAFNQRYKTDFIAMSNTQWSDAIKVIKKALELKIPISFNI